MGQGELRLMGIIRNKIRESSMTPIKMIKEWFSQLSIKNESIVYLKVDSTKQQRRQKALTIGIIVLTFQLILTFLMSVFKYLQSSQLSLQPFLIACCLLFTEIVLTIAWLFLHSVFSPVKKWRIASLLKLFAEENDILRKHKSEVDSTQSIRWEYYLESGMVFVKLFQGGHVTKGRVDEIPQALLAFLVKETRDPWYLEQHHIGDGFVKMVFSHVPDEPLHIKGYEDFKHSDILNVRLTKRLKWTTKQPMGLIVGPTGSGKTSLIKYLILGFLINDKRNEVFTIDGKGAYLSQSMQIIGEVATTGEDAFQMILNLEHLMNKRYTELNADTSKDEDVTHHEKFCQGQVLLIIDEYLALVTTMQAEDKLRKPAERLFPQFYAKLMNLIVKGRQASIFVIVSGQMIPTSILPSEARDSLGMRIALGRISQSQATEIFNMSKSELPSADSSLFEGIIYLDGLGLEYPIVFRTPFYDDGKLPFRGALSVLKSERSLLRSDPQNK